MRRAVSAVLVACVLSATLSIGMADVASAQEASPTEVAPEREPEAGKYQSEGLSPDTEAGEAVRERNLVDRPAAERAVVAVGRDRRQVGQGPVSVAIPDRAGRTVGEGRSVPQAVAVEVLAAQDAPFVGRDGLGFVIERTDGIAEPGPLDLEVSYDEFRQAFGGDWATRLVLMRYPECALETPDDDECSQGVVVPSENDLERGVVRAVVDLDIDSEVADGDELDETTGEGESDGQSDSSLEDELPTDETGTATTVPDSEEPTTSTSVPDSTVPSTTNPGEGAPSFARSAPAQSGGGSGGVYGLTSGVAGTANDYGATSLSQTSRWSAGGQAGDFSWSYPIEVPEATVGPTPNLALSYSAQAVDGFTAAENGQAGFVGAGWDLSGLGFIEREYRSCSEDGSWIWADLCWHSQNATINLNGVSSRLVPVSPWGDQWRLENDPGWSVRLNTGASNGDNNGEWWVVQSPDGTEYWFGRGREKESTASTPTNSAWTVPVYGNDWGDPCWDATPSNAWCQQAYRWNLDHVIDRSGSYLTVFYEVETNRYGREGTPSKSTSYIRGGRPERIEYSKRSGNHTPANQVLVTAAGRCLEAQFGVSCPSLSSSNANSWPDVPIDLICTSTSYCTKYAPSFFSTKRLESIYTVNTVVGSSSQTAYVADRFAVQTRYPDPGDGTDPKLWLNEVKRTGEPAFLGGGGSPLSMPPVLFDGNFYPNRADANPSAGVPVTNVKRITRITEELGAKIEPAYGQPGHPCTSMSGNWHVNYQYCFPVYFKPTGQPAGWSVNNKYVVTSVAVRDTTGLSPDQVTTYSYGDSPAWHHDDDPVRPASQQSWSDWRGHSKVTESDGLSTTSYLYYRGMYGDKLTGGATRTTVVQTATGLSTNDSDWLAGQLREERQLESGSTKVGTIYDHHVIDKGSGQNMTARMVLPDYTQQRTVHSGGVTYTTENTTYDSEGFPTRIHNLGEAGNSDDDRCITYEYARQWNPILDRVARETLDYNCVAPFNQITDTYYSNAGWKDPGATGAPTSTRQHLDPNGTGAYIEVKASYDAYGRTISTTDGRNNTTTTSYSPSDHRLTGSVTETQPLGYVNTTTLDPVRGQPKAIVDIRGQTLSQTYDSLGRLTSVTLPQDPSGMPSAKFTYTVDQTVGSRIKTERLTGLPGAYGYVAEYLYVDGQGRDREYQSPGPNGGSLITRTRYTAQGDIARESLPFYHSTTPGTAVLDASNPPGDHHFSYDQLGRPTQDRIYEWGSQVSTAVTLYDGFRTVSVTPEGRKRLETVDANGYLLNVEERNKDNSVYTTTRYTTSFDGQVKTIVDDPDGNGATSTGSSTTTYGYDMLGRRTATNDPDSGTSATTYDANNNPVMTTDANSQVITTVYDELNRPIERKLPSGDLLAEWTYHNTGPDKGLADTTTTHHPDGDWVATVDSYDIGGRPTSTTLTVPSSAGSGLGGSYTTTTNLFDAAGRPASVTMPGAANLPSETVLYNYTTLGLPSSMSGTIGSTTTTLVDSTDYAYAGQVAVRTLGDGQNQVEHAYTWDNQRRLATQKAQILGSSVIQDDRFTYDYDNNTTKIQDAVSGQWQCFVYDDQARLTDAWTNDNCDDDRVNADHNFGPDPYELTLTYDRIGNIETRTLDGTTTTYTYGQNGAGPHAATTVTEGANTTTYTYDANGQRTAATPAAGPADSYTWDSQRRLVSIDDGTDDTTNIYDAGGNRLLRREPDGNGGTTTTLYLGGQELTRTNSGATTATRFYSSGSDLVAMRTGAGLSWLSQNYQGSLSHQVEAGTANHSTQRYLPTGATRGNNTLTDTDRDFLGKARDTSTGLSLLGARYYDSGIGLFISPDPLTAPDDPQHLNGYSYSRNNPTSMSDPSGLWPSGGKLGAMLKGLNKGLVRRSRPSSSISIGDVRIAVRKGQVRARSNPAKKRAYAERVTRQAIAIAASAMPRGSGLSAWEQVKAGVGDGIKGLGHAITHPLDTAKGIAYLSNPWLITYDGIAAFREGGIEGFTDYTLGNFIDIEGCKSKGIIYCASSAGTQVVITAGVVKGGGALLKGGSAALKGARPGMATPPSVVAVGEVRLPGVPKGATGVAVESGRGLQYPIPRGTPELHPNVAAIRIMDPVTTGRYQYPNGYAVYMNGSGQTVDPLTGRTIPRSDPNAHIPLD